MYGTVLGTTSTVTGVVGVAVLPSTGSTRPLFYAAGVLFAGGLVALVVSSIVAHKGRKNEA